ncbi:SPOR domain-containing protein [Mesorhizobium sp. PAMC28654]|uniref:SPOR domain-containing protein n=1 Tax=Mesorhizobium sp. PAMC28654 TaxID=2880934 RepID=UPI001D0A9082|nr:SPOR domain-containing protein [Mesorhizobium sp. PAMC28654]UDL90057.1 SPOR domain-containing protein [Mesorhizobium sp. PAMC28654]
MADRTQLRAADRNDIADDDPFAELTRIMGFDPRQPVKPQASVQPLAAVDHRTDEADFDIDLEKELMGDFGDSEAASVVQLHEPTFETAAADTVDDDLAMSLDEDFHLDAADIAHHGADQTAYGAVQASEPAVDAAFDDDFDNAVASSLEDVSPFEDDQPMEDELASSFEQNFQLDGNAVDHAEHFAQAAPAIEPAFDHEFDNAVANSLEDELMFDDSLSTQDHQSAPEAEYQSPGQTHAYQSQATSDEDFAGHFDDAMTDVGIDFDQPTAADQSVAMIEELDAHGVHAEPVATRDETVGLASTEAFDHDFELNFDDALAEEAHEPLAQLAAPAVQPTITVPVAPVVQPVQAPVANERSLEDELNALLGAMSARTAPVVATEPAMVQQPVVQQPVAVAEHAAEEPADLVGDLDWDLDEHASSEPRQDQAAQPASADLDSLLLDELQGHDFAAGDAMGADVANVDFDKDAFDAAFARSIGLDDDRADDKTSNAPRSATPDDTVDSLNWLAERSTPPEPARSWSRVTPVAQPPVAPVATPLASFAAVAVAPAVMAASAYRPEPIRSEPVRTEPVYAAPAPVQQEQSARYDEMPDVETVDVPERVVALADDLDIPELHFEEDEPASAGYDDLDSEFASLLTEMNTMDVPAAAPARSPAYDDESYGAGFKPSYEQTTQGYAQAKPGYDQAKPGYGQDRVEARTYAARPTEMPAAASYADAAGFDVNELPGSQPVSQADDFTVDELDYDPELDEAMAVPGLAAQENARQPRRRGLFIAAIVGGVAIAGGLGAFALSFGGKGSGGAPVIVKADNAPIKVKPENPGGTVVPNQDNKVYDAVLKGAKPAEQVQQKLVTNTEKPVDVAAKDQQTRVVDLSPDQTDAAPGTDAAGNPDTAAAPVPKSEDRIAQVLQDADKGTNTDVVAVAPRKVRTMVVKADGSLVAREDPAPAAQQVAAAEPTDPAPQHVAPSAQDDSQATGAVSPADQTTSDPAKPASALKPVAVPKAEAKAQSANTPAKVPVAPQRPSDQPVDVVGEVKPDQVASIDPAAAAAAGGSWSIQIASQPTVDSAQSTYQDLQRRYGSVLGGRTANIVKAEIAGKGTFYRVRVPAQSRNDAINLCTSYKAAGGNCFVSR